MMKQRPSTIHTRRDVLGTGLAGITALVFASSHPLEPWQAVPAAFAGESTLAPTPACSDADDPTPAQTEGPYYKPNSPERQTLREAGMAGTPLRLSGLVLSRRCEPAARILLDFWQADDRGAYDNQGHRLRGHQFTDESGRYQLETIIPGLYPGRTRHIHVKVQPPNGSILTSQLYFPGEPRNRRDRLFRPTLLLRTEETSDGQLATFNFVLDIT